MALQVSGTSLHDIAPWSGESFGLTLLTPTIIYVRDCMRLVAAADVRGLVHMTGGGFPENIPRVVPKGLAARINRSAWEVPPLFQWVQEVGGAGMELGTHCLLCLLCVATLPNSCHLFKPLLTSPTPVLHLQAGTVPDSEMFRTFNMGVGMVIVVPPGEVDKVMDLGLGAFVMGEIVEGQGVQLV